MTREQVVNQYYESSEGLRLTEHLAIPGLKGSFVVETATPPLHHTENIDPRDVDEVLEEVSRNLEVIEHDGSWFEISIANGDASNQDVMLHISTYSSAISTNPGNGYEFAAQAVRYPQYRHLYVASFGNGSTGPLLAEDVAYVRSSGRFTRDEDDKQVPIKSIRNLHAALEKSNLNVTRIMGTDSAGGHYARALAVAMEEEQLSHAFFSETSGFVNLSIRQIVAGMLYKENVRNAKINQEISPDPEQMDDEKQARFKEAYEKYADTSKRQEIVRHKVGSIATARSMYTSIQALKRGPVDNSPIHWQLIPAPY